MDLADGVFGDVSIPADPQQAEEAIARLLDVSTATQLRPTSRTFLLLIFRQLQFD